MTRHHSSLLSATETRVLTFIVERIPASVSPDHLTAFAMFGAVLTFLAYALSHISVHFLWLSSLGLFLHWFGDSLDGTLARYRNRERPRFGFFIDQNADVLGNLLVGFGLAISPFVRADVALIALLGYQALAIYALIIHDITRVFHVTLAYSGPTEVRLLLVTMNTLIIIFGAPTWTIWGIPYHWCDVTIGTFAIGCFMTFIVLVAAKIKPLRDEDTAQMGTSDEK